MISLIRNELTKIFKKKAIYITLLVTLIFIVICNIIIKMQNNGIGYDVTASNKFYEEQLKQLDPENEEDREIYIIYQTQLETGKLIEKYGGYQSWQTQIIEGKVEGLLNQMHTYEYASSKDTKAYQELKKEYDAIISRLDTDDWRYFAKEELKEVQANLAQTRKRKEQMQNKSELNELNDMIYHLELEEQILNWRLEKDISYAQSYHNTCLMNYRSAKVGIAEYESSGDKEDYSQKQDYYRSLKNAAIYQYDIEHKTTVGNTSDAKGILLDVFNEYEIFIVVMIIMIAGSIVSDEFSKGTIKLLLIKPFKRTTILASKWITSFIVLIIVILLVMAMQFIVGGIIQGFDSFNNPTMVYNYNTHELQEMNLVSYLGMQMLGKLPIYILLMTLAFGISTIFTNSALAITLTLLGYMGSPLINQVGLAFELKWLKFFVTPNWDLTQYFFGGLPDFEGLTPMFSVAIILVYMVIMLVPTFIILKKKNIKNI